MPPISSAAERAALVVADAQLDPGQREADRAAAALAVPRQVGVRGQHRGLAHAVALEDGVAGALAPGLEGLDQHRRRAADEEAHVAAGHAIEPRLGEHAHVERRHAHEDGGARQQADDAAGVEAVEPEHLRAGEQGAVRGDEQAVHMEDRQGVDQHVAALGRRAPAPVALQRHRVRDQVAVAEHRPLAAPGGAAGVEDGGEVVAAALRRKCVSGK